MNDAPERAVNAARAVLDLTYTALAIGIVLYTFRQEVRRVVNDKRTAIQAHTARVREAARETRARAGFYGSAAFRDSLIRQENMTEDCGCDDA